MNHLIVSCIGPDKTGLVDALSKVIRQNNGNWQVSSLHHLSGFFAGVIEVAVESQYSDRLTLALKAIPGLTCQIELAEPNYSSVTSDLILDITANDRAGIIQEVSSIIHHNGGNLIKLVSTQDNAPHTGQAMFKAKVRVALAEQNITPLITALENIADDLMVDISR